MARKSFTTYRPETGEEFDVNGRVFRLNPAVPGDVLLDFLSNSAEDSPAAPATTIRSLLDAAIVEEQLDEWHAFIRDPENAIDLSTLSEIAGFCAEKLSGSGKERQKLPASFGPG